MSNEKGIDPKKLNAMKIKILKAENLIKAYVRLPDRSRRPFFFRCLGACSTSFGHRYLTYWYLPYSVLTTPVLS